jgi:hypothetical protein
MGKKFDKNKDSIFIQYLWMLIIYMVGL